ncbi:hypothetical protein [Flexithrix dorotheae]|uniref:hypothetical protein n=1 Tax=Flexithrix dorotheae TaxID=70993 RepID=UPI0012F93B14|nr:hypothetical protein [Flexithrix dorotheae]
MVLVKPLWIFSMLGFLAVDLLTYSYFPLSIEVPFGLEEQAQMQVNRSTFFYTAFFIMLGLNVLLNFLGKSLPYVPEALVFVPNKNKWYTNIKTRKEFFANNKSWVRGLALILNMLLSIFLGIIYGKNSDNSYSLTWTIYLIGMLLAGWLIYFFIMNASKPEALKGD